MKELFQYQVEDVRKLKKVPNALIGSEMGTGKTIEALELIRDRLEGRKHLVVTPLSTFETWQKAIEDQLGARYLIIDPKDRNLFSKAIKFAKQGIFVIHYQALRLVPELFEIEFDTIIADECHRVSIKHPIGSAKDNDKSKETLQTRAFKQLKSSYKIAMSGTATGDKPQNFWGILHWLYPKDFSSYWWFVQKYIQQEINMSGYREFTGVKNQKELHKKIDKFYVRHLKKEKCCKHHPKGVNPFMPDKVYSKVTVDLSPRQRKIYDQMQDEMVAWLNETEDTPLVASIAIAKLVRLSQMTLATPSFADDGTLILNAPSTKLDMLKEILQDNYNEKITVFTTSRLMANLVHKELLKAKINNVIYSGDQDLKQRNQAIRTLATDPNINVIVATVQTMGTGIDGLQDVCSTAIFLDRSLKVIENKQAEDRLHRIGQKNSVNIIDIVANDTIDIDRIELNDFKWSNIKKILGDKR